MIAQAIASMLIDHRQSVVGITGKPAVKLIAKDKAPAAANTALPALQRRCDGMNLGTSRHACSNQSHEFKDSGVEVRGSIETHTNPPKTQSTYAQPILPLIGLLSGGSVK